MDVYQEKKLCVKAVCEAIEAYSDKLLLEDNLVLWHRPPTKNYSPIACLVTIEILQEDAWGRRFVLQFNRQQDILASAREQIENCVTQMRKSPDLNRHALDISLFGSPTWSYK